MKISTKGRYAIYVMLDLGEHLGEDYISLKDIAERQGISMKYLESIVAMLNKAGLVDSLRGKNGGYRLNRPTSQYPIGEVIKLTEGPLAPVACLSEGTDHVKCAKASECMTLPMWLNLDLLIDQYLSHVTLADLLEHRVKPLGKDALSL
ncbi:MAG: Rrf2 family transcriptional regulator [Lachnospiraceae bacterium]|nr:Rrf2 family transcriptional regulator [Lachnospiraceae bacterium]